MSKGRNSLLIPSDERFLSNKDISDRLYIWILLNGEKIDTDIYINKTPRDGYKELEINYRTFYRKLYALVANGYLNEMEDKYEVTKNVSNFVRYIYKDIAEKLCNTKIDNIIKVYVYLGSLYSSYGNKAWFTYNTILNSIGYATNDTRNQSKVKIILEKLEELNLIKYSRVYNQGDSYQIKFQLLDIVSEIKKGEGKK